MAGRKAAADKPRTGKPKARRGSLRDAATLADFVRNLQVGVYVTNTDGRILDANPAFLRMFGLTSLRELADVSAERLFVDPGRRADELAILAREGAVREFEFEIRRPDGSPSFNLFGIKAAGGWRGESVNARTTEFVEGAPRRQSERFRAYGSYSEAFQDWANLMANSPRYARVLRSGDSVERFASGMQRAGYAWR